MDTLSNIPLEFVRGLTDLDWQDVRFGLQNNLLSKSDVSRFAAYRVADSANTDPDILELAGVSAGDDVDSLVGRLAAKNGPAGAGMTDKWLYVALAWIFEQRASFDDPLKQVSGVYADFGYPDSIKHFVPYMPMVGDNLGTRHENEARIYERWAEFLRGCRQRFGHLPSEQT